MFQQVTTLITEFKFERVAVAVATASAITLNWDEAEFA